MPSDTRQKVLRGLRIGLMLAVLVPSLALIIGYAMAQAGYRVTVNLTPSIPQGFYLADSAVPAVLRRGQLVAFYPHSSATQYAYDQGWVKPGAAYVKAVAAVAGDTVCVGAELTIRTRSGPGQPAEFRRVGPVHENDRTGRPLPHLLRGCQQVPDGYILPIGEGLPNSYDGRYYGFIPSSEVTAVLRPLITWGGTPE